MRRRSNIGNTAQPRVLVLGSDTRVVLPVIRSLGRRGIEVHVGWCSCGEPALSSRYVHSTHDLPQLADRDWKPSLRALMRRQEFQLVIPVMEDAVLALQSNRREFEELAPLYLLPDAVFDVVFDKLRTHELAMALGVPVARCTHVSCADVSHEQLEALPIPAVIKPRSSVRSIGMGGKICVQVIDDRQNLAERFVDIAERTPDVLVQEFFPGRGVGVEILAEGGNILYAFQHERLHETRGYGSTYRMSVPLKSELLSATTRLINELNYTGVGMFEFRVNPNTGEWIFVEINGRFWGSLPLAVASGADFPFFLYQMLCEGRRVFPRDYRVGVRCRNLSYDVAWFWRSVSGWQPGIRPPDDGLLGWAVNRVSGVELLGELLRTLGCRDRIDTFSLDDPLPCATEALQLIRKGFRRISRLILGQRPEAENRQFGIESHCDSDLKMPAGTVRG